MTRLSTVKTIWEMFTVYQYRVARVLMLCDPTPPTVSVDGIGRRIDEHTFWVEG